MPQVPGDFSNYQLSRLLGRSRTSKKLEDVRSALKSEEAAGVSLGEESQLQEVESNRIVSSDSAHYILVKGMDLESMSSSSQTDDEASDGRHGSSNKCLGSSGSSHGNNSSYHGNSDSEPDKGAGGIARSKKEDIGTSKLVTVEARSRLGLGADNNGEKREALDLGGDYLVLASDSEEEGELVSMEEQLSILRDIQSMSGKDKEERKVTAVAEVSSHGLDEEGSDSDVDAEVVATSRLHVGSLETRAPRPNDPLPVASGSPGTSGAVAGPSQSAFSLSVGEDVVDIRPSSQQTISISESRDKTGDGSIEVTEEQARHQQELPASSCREVSRDLTSDSLQKPEEHYELLADRKGTDQQSSKPEHSLISGIVRKEGEEEERRGGLEDEEEGRSLLEEERRVLEEERHVLEEEFVALVEEGGADGAQEQLQADVARLERERARQTRAATGVSNTMYRDAQVKGYQSHRS